MAPMFPPPLETVLDVVDELSEPGFLDYPIYATTPADRRKYVIESASTQDSAEGERVAVLHLREVPT